MLVNRHAAGIDIGARDHYVSVGDDHQVRKFPSVTDGLRAMAIWLKECGVQTVAMEATGVYWQPVFQLLADDFEVVLVNAKHFKNVPGRKSDVQDCQWLQHLHACGLLRGSFRPANDIVELRTYMRQRTSLVQGAAREILHMQKALDQMNIQLHHVVSDTAGRTGMSILGAIVAGERDPEKLALLRRGRAKRSHQEFVAALTGDWRAEHLFCLEQSWRHYHFLQEQIASCDEQIRRLAAAMTTLDVTVEIPEPAKHTADEDLRAVLYRTVGVDAAAIHGFSPQTVLSLISEVGIDMAAWPTADHFASWLRLCPNNRVTGGRIQSSKTLPSRNRAAAVLRKSAENLARSQCFLGAFYRRMRARRGGPFAVVATARKLACIFYTVLRTKRPYRDIGKDHYDQNHRERARRSATKRLRDLGFEVQVTEKEPPAEVIR